MESQPQNPEFRINPENFHPRMQTDLCGRCHVMACSMCSNHELNLEQMQTLLGMLF